MVNRYQYNGKEFETDLGLMWNDYGARWYDLQIGRWGQIDPLAEKYAAWSGYNYVGGNPIRHVDFDGRSFGWYEMGGMYVYDPEVTTQAQVTNLGGGKYMGDAFETEGVRYDKFGGVHVESDNTLTKIVGYLDDVNTSVGFGGSIMGTTIDALKDPSTEKSLQGASDFFNTATGLSGRVGIGLDAIDTAIEPSAGKITMLTIDVGVAVVGGPQALGVVDGAADLTGLKQDLVDYVDSTETGKNLNAAGRGYMEMMKESFNGLSKLIKGGEK